MACTAWAVEPFLKAVLLSVWGCSVGIGLPRALCPRLAGVPVCVLFHFRRHLTGVLQVASVLFVACLNSPHKGFGCLSAGAISAAFHYVWAATPYVTRVKGPCGRVDFVCNCHCPQSQLHAQRPCCPGSLLTQQAHVNRCFIHPLIPKCVACVSGCGGVVTRCVRMPCLLPFVQGLIGGLGLLGEVCGSAVHAGPR